ncbi:MAG TPA: PE-PPE domain-containing protein [Mycobacterium sp.]|nr:PE-PPE domain-containing protein [Mycobacterium sp.]
MNRPLRAYLTTGIAITGAGLIAIPALPPVSDVQSRALRLAGVDTANSPLGDGTALILGASGTQTPGQLWMDDMDKLYLAPRGFTGHMVPVTTPESLYPDTGTFSGELNPSVAQGEQIVENAIKGQIAAGGVSAANPVVVDSYSQSSVIDSLAQPQLADQGVPSDDAHFVMVGDVSAPNGGLLERFDFPPGTSPTFPSMGVTMSGSVPSDLYPTDVYTLEYDGFADFPQYPINTLADLNAIMGIVLNHTQYMGLTAQQVTPVADGGDAILLPTSTADTLVNYYMIPSDSLPLLDPLRLLPVLGNPLADLIQPDLEVLVNLGYGSVSQGWSPGDADVATPLGFLPPASVLAQVPEALANGLTQGVQAFLKDLTTPSNYEPVSPETDSDFLVPLEKSDQADSASVSSDTTQGPSFTELPPHTGVPAADVTTALLATLPEINEKIFDYEVAQGNYLDAIGIPLAYDQALILLGAALAAEGSDPVSLGSIFGFLTDPGSFSPSDLPSELDLGTLQTAMSILLGALTDQLSNGTLSGELSSLIGQLPGGGIDLDGVTGLLSSLGLGGVLSGTGGTTGIGDLLGGVSKLLGDLPSSDTGGTGDLGNVTGAISNLFGDLPSGSGGATGLGAFTSAVSDLLGQLSGGSGGSGLDDLTGALSSFLGDLPGLT